MNLITAPQIEPVTLTDMENQVVRGGCGSLSDEAAIIDLYIKSARMEAEGRTGRAFITQSHELILDGFPSGRGAIKIPMPPLQSVESITYVDTNGITQTLDPLAYRVIAEMSPTCPPGNIIPAYGLSWPVTRDDVAVVSINFTCGYGPLTEGGSSNVPEPIKHWILLNSATAFENREGQVVASGRLTEVDFSTYADGKLANFKVYKF